MSSSILPLRARDLRFLVDTRPLIDGVSLTIEPGSSTVVLGPNGTHYVPCRYRDPIDQK